MSSILKPNKARALADVQAIIAGTQKHLPTGTFTIGNGSYAAASLVQLFQSLVDAMAKQNEAQTTAKDALTELRDVRTRVNPVLKGYRQLLVTMFGEASQTLADFGLAPHKVRAPLTVEQKALAKAKRQATRIARGTKGRKAKLAIKGTLPVDKPAPPVTPPAKSSS